jgi:hypothetical protein
MPSTATAATASSPSPTLAQASVEVRSTVASRTALASSTSSGSPLTSPTRSGPCWSAERGSITRSRSRTTAAAVRSAPSSVDEPVPRVTSAIQNSGSSTSPASRSTGLDVADHQVRRQRP